MTLPAKRRSSELTVSRPLPGVPGRGCENALPGVPGRGQLTVCWRADFLTGPLRRAQVRAGMTIEEIVLELGDRLPQAFFVAGAAWLSLPGGLHGCSAMQAAPHGAASPGMPAQRIERGLWHLVRPRAGTELLFVGDLRGGGNGSALQTVASLALLASTVFITGGALSGLASLNMGVLGSFSLFGAGTTSAQLLAAGVLVGGSLALQALAPRPALPSPDPGLGEDMSGRSAALSGNVLAPGATAPYATYQRRVAPVLVCNPLIEIVGGDVVAEAVYALGGAHLIEEPRAGTTKFADIDSNDIAYEIRAGQPAEAVIQSLVNRHSFTQQIGSELVRHTVDKNSPWKLATAATPAKVFASNDRTPVFTPAVTSGVPTWMPLVSRSIDGRVDEIWTVLGFPEGIGSNGSASTIIYVPVRMRIRKKGDSSWINLPEMWFAGATVRPLQYQVKLVWGTAPADTDLLKTVTTDAGDSGTALNIVGNEGPAFLYGNVPVQNLAGSAGGWTVHSYFRNAARANEWFAYGTVYAGATPYAGNTSRVINVDVSRDSFIFYLNEATFPKGDYEIQVMVGTPAAKITLADYSYTSADNGGTNTAGTRRDFFGYATDGGVPRIPNTQNGNRGRCVVQRVSSIILENPLQSYDYAHLAVRVKNRNLDQVTVLASAYVHDWDGTGWRDLKVTDNPAPHLYAVRAGRLLGRPIPASLIDDDDLVALRSRAAAQGYSCRAVFDGRSADDCAQILLGAAYAQARQAEKWGCFYDRDRSAEAPVQMFNPRNLRGFSFENVLAERPRGLRVRFDDAADDFKEKTIYVDDPFGVAPDAPYEEVRYEGIVAEAAARARALYDQKASYHRQVLYSFETDAEALIARRGALIGVTHDALTRHAGFARIRSTVLNGSGQVTQIVLDAAVPFAAEGSFFTHDNGLDFFTANNEFFTAARIGCWIRLNDGTFVTSEVTGDGADPTATLTLSVPFAAAADLLDGALVATGLLGAIYERMIVVSIVPQSSDGQSAIVAMPEAPQIWS